MDYERLLWTLSTVPAPLSLGSGARLRLNGGDFLFAFLSTFFSPQLFPLLAAAILSFRKENLLRVSEKFKDISRRTILQHVITSIAICQSTHSTASPSKAELMMGVKTSS